jgi:hypothetical protein
VIHSSSTLIKEEVEKISWSRKYKQLFLFSFLAVSKRYYYADEALYYCCRLTGAQRWVLEIQITEAQISNSDISAGDKNNFPCLLMRRMVDIHFVYGFAMEILSLHCGNSRAHNQIGDNINSTFFWYAPFLHFYLWGCMEIVAYATQVRDRNDPINGTEVSVADIVPTQPVSARLTSTSLCSCEVWVQAEGGHFSICCD